MLKSESSVILGVLLGIDVIITGLNIVQTGNIGVDHFFSLALESNFTTWYSSAKLLCGAFLCWLVLRSGLQTRWPIQMLGIMLVCISMSETAMFHERTAAAIHTIRTGEIWINGGGGTWVIYLSPIVVVSLIVFGRAYLRLRQEFLQTGNWLLAGFAAWVVVLVAETAPLWGDRFGHHLLDFAVIIEEFCEMAGATFVAYGLSIYLVHRTDEQAQAGRQAR